MATEKMINALSEALIKAKEHAKIYSIVEDDGTCNFDTPQLSLKGWKINEINKAFSAADVTHSVKKTAEGFLIDILRCTDGFGNRRTKMAEAIRDSLKADGFESYVYYQMD